ncbi:MAG: HAD family hydrolase [Desulfosarcinaceae bacterium]|nr:HAD family hydrolase [Desulfosarcinaceae bacterium]
MLDSQLGELISPRRPRPTNESPRGALRRPVRAVLFDVYGTLLISASGDIDAGGDGESGMGSTDALDRRVRDLGFVPPADGVRSALRGAIRQTHRRLRSRGFSHPEVVIEKVWGELYPAASESALRRLALAYELTVNPVWPMPAMRRCLAALKADGLRLGIISNAQFYTPLLLRHFLGGPLLEQGFTDELCHYSFRCGAAKPGPALFESAQRALAQIGIAAGAAVMVGNDRRNDVAAAKTAGFQTVLFAGDARSLRWRREDPDWATAQPDMVITDLLQLSRHLTAPP